MKLFKAVATACCKRVMGAALATGVKADDWTRKTATLLSGPAETAGGRLAGRGAAQAAQVAPAVQEGEAATVKHARTQRTDATAPRGNRELKAL